MVDSFFLRNVFETGKHSLVMIYSANDIVKRSDMTTDKYLLVTETWARNCRSKWRAFLAALNVDL